MQLGVRQCQLPCISCARFLLWLPCSASQRPCGILDQGEGGPVQHSLSLGLRVSSGLGRNYDKRFKETHNIYENIAMNKIDGNRNESRIGKEEVQWSLPDCWLFWSDCWEHFMLEIMRIMRSNYQNKHNAGIFDNFI